MTRPCDCKSIDETKRLLNEQGIAFGNDSITVVHNKVVLKMGHTTVNIPMNRFKQFAEWYLEDQEGVESPVIRTNCPPLCSKCMSLHYHNEQCRDIPDRSLKGPVIDF